MNISSARSAANQAALRYRLAIAKREWSGRTGEVLGSGVGSSLDFMEHRPYVAGDDLRHMDWRAYARTGHLTLKLFREEVCPVVELCIDRSASMSFLEAKEQRCWELLFFLREASERARASLKVWLQEGYRWRLIREEEWGGTANWWMERNRPSWEALPFRPGSLRIVLSDLLEPGDPGPLLNRMLSSRGRVMVLAPFVSQEEFPDWHGPMQLVDCESGESQDQRVDQAVLSAYEVAYRNHFAIWRQACRQRAAGLARINCEGSLIEALRGEALREGLFEIA